MVANHLADTFEETSSDHFYTDDFLRHKIEIEEREIAIAEDNTNTINYPLTREEKLVHLQGQTEYQTTF